MKDATGPRELRDDDGKVIANKLTYAADKLGLDTHPKLRRVVKRGRREATYDLELDDGTLIPLGPIGHLKDPRRVEDAVGDARSWMPKLPGREKFLTTANCLLAIAELEDTGVTPEDTTRGWVAGFAAREITGDGAHDVSTSSARAELLAFPPAAFRGTDGCVYVHLRSLAEHLRFLRVAGASERELGPRLQRLGFTRTLLEGPRGEDGLKQGRRKYWRSPEGYDLHAE